MMSESTTAARKAHSYIGGQQKKELVKPLL